MGGTNYGTQTITIKWYESDASQAVNRIGKNVRRLGIYEGAWLTKVDNVTVTLSPLECEIGDGTHQVRVKTADNVTVTVAVATPYVVLRWAYTEATGNYMDVLALALGDILSTDLVVGKCTYVGSTLQGIDYTNRDDPDVFDKFLKVEPAVPASMKIMIRGGRVSYGSSNLDVITQESTALVAPGTNSRIALIYIENDGSVQVSYGATAASPVAPDWGGKIGIAEVTLTAGMSTITASSIKDVRSFMTASAVASGDDKTLEKDLVIQNNSGTPNSRLDMTATHIFIEGVKISSLSVTIDITSIGANGLDAGSEASSTMYHLFAICNDDGSSAAGLLSISATAPTLPAGYTKKQLVGFVYNNASSNFLQFRQRGRYIAWDDNTQVLSAASGFEGMPPTLLSLMTVISGSIPLIVHFYAYTWETGSSGTSFLKVRPYGFANTSDAMMAYDIGIDIAPYYGGAQFSRMVYNGQVEYWWTNSSNFVDLYVQAAELLLW